MSEVDGADREPDGDRPDAHRGDPSRAHRGDPFVHRRHHDDPDAWLPRWHPASLLAYAWARLAVVAARRGHRSAVDARVPRPPGWLPDGARHGMVAALYHTGARCLVSATVRRAWDRAHGRPRQLVIGVTAPSTGFRAHAWLDGDPPCCSADFTELLRR